MYGLFSEQFTILKKIDFISESFLKYSAEWAQWGFMRFTQITRKQKKNCLNFLKYQGFCPGTF